MDRYRKGFRATEVLVWLTAAHLTRRVPSCVDPWHAVAVVLSTPRRALAVLVGVALAAVMVRCLPSPGDDLSPRHWARFCADSDYVWSPIFAKSVAPLGFDAKRVVPQGKIARRQRVGVRRIAHPDGCARNALAHKGRELKCIAGQHVSRSAISLRMQLARLISQFS